jgi:hypothetical protein
VILDLPGIAGSVRFDAFSSALGVSIEPTTVGGVKAFIPTPKEIPKAHKNQLVFNLHEGGYVFSPGEAGTGEAALMAAYGGYKVLAIDYRMPPDAPYGRHGRRDGRMARSCGDDESAPHRRRRHVDGPLALRGRSVSHRQNDAELCVAAHHPRVGLARSFERKRFDHGPQAGEFGAARCVLGIARRPRSVALNRSSFADELYRCDLNGIRIYPRAFRPVTPRRRVPHCRWKASTIADVTTRIRAERRRS